MQFLIDFAANDGDFERILRHAGNYGTVQGVVLDIDRLWLHLWTLKDRWGEDYLKRVAHDQYGWPYWSHGADARSLCGSDSLPSPFGLCDVEGWRPPGWGYRQERFGLPPETQPIIVKICLRPKQTPDETYPTVRDLDAVRGRLQVEVEIRPRARLSSNPRRHHSPLPGGVSIGIGASDYGTLGVILTDGHAYYGLTCAHVAGPKGTSVTHPSGRDSGSPAVIGKTVCASDLVGCPPGVACNPWSGAVPNEYDAALFEIDASKIPTLLEVLDVGPLTGVTDRASMTTTQPVQVMGRTSEFQSMQVGGLAPWYSFHHAGKDYCFKNLFEVHSPYGVCGVIQAGDSGAPVCAAGAGGTEWAGMIAGCDAFKGYAIYAQTLQDWLFGQGYTLRVM